MKTACPHCGKKYDVPDSAAGKQARCGNAACKQSFTVALPTAATPSSAAPSRQVRSGQAGEVHAVDLPAAAPLPPVAAMAPEAAAPPSAGGGTSLDSLLSMDLPDAAAGAARPCGPCAFGVDDPAGTGAAAKPEDAQTAACWVGGRRRGGLRGGSRLPGDSLSRRGWERAYPRLGRRSGAGRRYRGCLRQRGCAA